MRYAILSMTLLLLATACSRTSSSPSDLALPDVKQYTAAQEREAAAEMQLCIRKDPHASPELCSMTVDYGVMRKQTRAARVILRQR